MRFRESFNFAWRGIVANKMRALLTMLGIVIGIASVITLVAVGTGSNRAVAASIARLGSNTLNVSPMPTGTGGHGSAFQQQLRRMLGIKQKADNNTHDHESSLTFADAAALLNPADCPDVVADSPKVIVHTVATIYLNSSHTTQLFMGSTPNYLDVDNDTTSAGRNFTQAEYDSHARVVIIGTSVAADLAQGDPAELLGKDVRFNGQAFRVVGILGSKGYSGQSDLDDKVIAPATATEDALYGYHVPGTGQLSSIAVQAASAQTLSQAQREVQTVMDKRHNVSAANTDVIVYNAASILAAGSESSHTLTILLGAVAGISLLVGGIGVMNIMLVSVTERTREIGIRKAIGANRRDIISQFLGEAVILSMIGGVAGVLIGFACSRFTIVGVQPVVAPWSVIMALTVSLFTGLFFGLYPAARAADLRPIDALRYE
jgi:putative ABC transport system permease protein